MKSIISTLAAFVLAVTPAMADNIQDVRNALADLKQAVADKTAACDEAFSKLSAEEDEQLRTMPLHGYPQFTMFDLIQDLGFNIEAFEDEVQVGVDSIDESTRQTIK